jgi:Amt family ammonium transporter
MRRKVRAEEKLRFGQKVSRLRTRLRDPQWRKFGLTLLAAKAIALIILVLLITLGPKLLDLAINGQTAFAQQAASTQPTALTSVVQATDPYVNPINTLWTLLGAFLVFGMQAGFTMLEAGFCRSRETVNVLVECVFDTCLCGILYWAWGYAFMFGAGNGFIGWHDPNDPTKKWFFLQNITAATTFGATGVPVLANWVFQFAFADCASTICSGTMIGRTSFFGDILYSICVSGFIYPILGHWAWGPDAFLAMMGSTGHYLPNLCINFHDFAGSTVVHSIGVWIALAGGIVLGPRLGRKFKRDGGGPMLPHDLTIAIVGGLILWFGWYGFNPGSTLSAMDTGGIGRISANTTLAACAGGLIAVIIGYALNKVWDASFFTNGFLAGLVAITASCYWVSPLGAVCLGGVAGALVIGGAELLEYLRIDDPVGAWPVHGLNGIWGTLSIGFFACGQYNAIGSSPTGIPPVDASNPALTGLFYGGGFQVLQAQLIGSAIICATTFVVAMAVFLALNAMGLLRVSEAGELEGLDIHEHGISAYPEYVISQVYAPHGMPAHSVNSVPATETVMARTEAAPKGAVPVME